MLSYCNRMLMTYVEVEMSPNIGSIFKFFNYVIDFSALLNKLIVILIMNK